VRPLVVGVDNSIGLSILHCFDDEASVHCADYQNFAQGLYRENTTPHTVSESTLGADVAAIIERTDATLVVPTRVGDLRTLVNHREQIAAAGGSIGLPETETVTQLTDRQWLASTFSELTPELISPDQTGSLPFPVVLRRRYGSIEGEPTPIEDAERLAYERRALEREGHTPLVQRHIPGPEENEYIVGQVYDTDGTLVGEGAVQMLSKRWRYWGKVVAAESVTDDDLLSTARVVGQHLGVSGCPLRLLFKRRPDGTFALLDVDPLFWEPTRLTARAGFNGPAALCAVFEGARPGTDAYTSGVRSVRNNQYLSVNETDILRPEES
jgi:predicted ATP-grasp superfamily ATP-dependent carboligase